MQNFPGILSKIASKMYFFYKFSEFFVRKRPNIHLNDEFPLKIANISLQKLNLLGMRFPNSTCCSCMGTRFFIYDGERGRYANCKAKSHSCHVLFSRYRCLKIKDIAFYGGSVQGQPWDWRRSLYDPFKVFWDITHSFLLKVVLPFIEPSSVLISSQGMHIPEGHFRTAGRPWSGPPAQTQSDRQ